MKKVSNFYWYSGIAAVVIYLTGVIVGGLLYPGYSHISMDISQLTSTGSPIRGLMNFAFWPYNALVSVFGFGLSKLGKGKLLQLGTWSIIFIGVLGFLIAFFPINTRGTAITFVGIAHITIVALVSLFTVASGFLIWRGLIKTEYAKVAKISFYSGLGFLIAGPVAGVLVMSPYAGLAERVPIGIFLAWILAVSTNLLRHKTNP